jgi:flagellar hook-associated protein 3 FlgL
MQAISTAANWNSALLNLTAAENQQNQAQNQVSSGKVAQDLGGFGQTAESITAMQASQTRLQGFIAAGQSVAATLTDQNTALTEVSDAGNAARQAVDDAIASGSAAGLMQTLQTQYQQVVAGLNTQSNGVYLFGGGRTDQAPVSVTTMSGLTSQPIPPTTAFQNGQFITTAQINSETTVQTGMLASDVGSPLVTVFQAIANFDAGPNGPLSGQLTQTQITFLQSQLSQFDSANTSVTAYTAQNGAVQKTVSAQITEQQNQSTTLQNMIGDKTDVDMATALSHLSQAQNAVTASAQVLASLQKDSLLSILPVG